MRGSATPARRMHTSDLACCSGRACSSRESPAQDPRKMTSGPTAHMQEGGAAALTLETCSKGRALSHASCIKQDITDALAQL